MADLFDGIVMAEQSKKRRALDSLIGMIQKFPYGDPTYEKLQEDLEKIRGKFKQLVLSLHDHLSAEPVEYGILFKVGGGRISENSSSIIIPQTNEKETNGVREKCGDTFSRSLAL
ncbi:hypothetical protein DUI87_25614 [Hirundo rustica rustica]|uniref:Uncharacterized protein n=1 Tax=Hirundo rustica rustica TaxID=333673 RepID=A0A3M0JTD0_HIRRU|nr:hypothetical protein DUI87_25614 [Hirundo rustica rustica]